MVVPLTPLFSDAQEVSKHLQFAVSGVSSITIASSHFNLVPFRFLISPQLQQATGLVTSLLTLFASTLAKPIESKYNMNPGSRRYVTHLSRLRSSDLENHAFVIIDQVKPVTLKFLQAMNIYKTAWMGRRASGWLCKEA